MRRGKADGLRSCEQIAAHQREVAGFDGDVGAASHRDAEVCLGECCGVVDAVADHGDDLSFLLQTANDGDFVGG